MKFKKRVILTPICLALSLPIITSGFFNSTYTTDIKNKSQYNLRSINEVAINGTLGDNFSLKYNEDHIIRLNNASIGRDGYWNIAFDNKTPQFMNYQGLYISDIPGPFITDIPNKPNETFSSNGIDIDYFDLSGLKQEKDVFKPIADTYQADPIFGDSQYGFSSNENDPYNLDPLSNKMPLIKLSYQYRWNNLETANLAVANGFDVINFPNQNRWAFNGYIGLTRDLNIGIFKPNGEPTIKAISTDFNKELTASDFINHFDDYKGLITIELANFLPINQFSDLKLSANNETGEVFLNYKVKNIATVDEQGWYSDPSSNISENRQILLVSGFWTDTKIIRNTIDGAKFTNGYTPITANAEIFKRWIYNNRKKIWSPIPEIAIGDVDVKSETKETTNDSLSYEVSIKKIYKGGEIVTEPSEPQRITITNFKSIKNTNIVAKNNYKTIDLKLGDEILNWEEATPAFIEKIINTNSQTPEDDNKKTLINKLALIVGDIPIVNGTSGNINDVEVSDTSTVNGTIDLVFNMTYAFDLSIPEQLVQDKKFTVRFEGLKKIFPTKQITSININGYENYLISSLNESSNQELVIALKTEISQKIIELYNQVENNENFGQIPSDTQVTEISFDYDSANNNQGTINIGYKLSKFYNDKGEIDEKGKLFDQKITLVNNFYTAIPTEFRTEVFVPGQSNNVPNINWLTSENLTNQGITLSDLVNNTYENIKLFDNTSIKLNSLDEITISPTRVSITDGFIYANLISNKGFVNEQDKIIYKPNDANIMIDNFIFKGFKETSQVYVKDNISIDINEINKLQQFTGIPPQLIANDNTSLSIIKNAVAEYIFKNIEMYIENAPITTTQQDIEILSSEPINFSNTEGWIELTIKFKKKYNLETGVIEESTDEDTYLIKKIRLENFLKIYNPTQSTDYQFSLNNYPEWSQKYAIEMTAEKIQEILNKQEIKTLFNVPNIKNDNPSLEAIGVITVDPQSLKYNLIDEKPVVEINVAIQNVFKQDQNDILYKKESVNFKVTFIDFKDVKNSIINPVIDNIIDDLLSQNYPQYFVMDDDQNKEITTLSALQTLLNQNINNIVDNTELLVPGAEIILSLTSDKQTSFDNFKGTLTLEAKLSKIFDPFHRPIENNNNSIITISNFKQLELPTFIQDVSIDISQNKIFGPNIEYIDQVTDELIIEKFNTDEVKKLFVNQGHIIPKLDKSNLSINRKESDSIIEIKISCPGFNDNGVELNPNYQSPFKGEVTTIVTINFKQPGTTKIKSTLPKEIPSKFVDDYYDPITNSLKDPNLLLNDIKMLFPDVKEMFDSQQGRIWDQLNWDNFSSISISTDDNGQVDDNINAATGTIPINFNMTSGYYYDNNVKVEATSQSPKIFSTIITTQNKRPITSIKKIINIQDINEFYTSQFHTLKDKYAYEMSEINNPEFDLYQLFINYFKSEECIKKTIINKNDLTFPKDQNPWVQSSNLFIDLTKQSITSTINNNKLGKIEFDLNVILNSSSIYDERGFVGTEPNKIQEKIKISINLKQGDIEVIKAEPTNLIYTNNEDKIIKIAKRDNESIDDILAKQKLSDLIYSEMYNVYKGQLDPLNPPDLEVFNVKGININETAHLSFEEFKDWIEIDISNAKIQASGAITNVSIIFKHSYFKNDEYATWVSANEKDNPYIIKDVTIIGFGPKKQIIWPYIVGASASVVVILITILIIWLIIRRKSKVKLINKE